MLAVRLHGIGDLRVEQVPEPTGPLRDWVHLRILAAGICGSDLHNFRSGQWLARTPSTPGHELAAEVTAIGPEVRSLRPGDRVVADSRVFCRDCDMCRSGRHNLCATLGFVGEVCDGGFAELTELPEHLLHRVPADLDPKIAAMAEPLAVALHTMHRLRPQPDAPILIAGCGPIGGLIALVLADAGFGPILVADRQLARARLVAEVTGGQIVELDATLPILPRSGKPVRHAVDATGNIAALQALIACAGQGARLALVGIFHGRLDIDPNLLVEREIDLAGCSAFADELPQAIAMLPRLAPRLARYIDEPIRLAEVPAAYQQLLGPGSSKLKTIIVPAR